MFQILIHHYSRWKRNFVSYAVNQPSDTPWEGAQFRSLEKAQHYAQAANIYLVLKALENKGD